MSSQARPRQTAVLDPDEPGDRLFFKKPIPFIAIFALFIALATVLALATGSFHSELSGETDEAAHYVTALMVHDYALHGLSQGPITYASNFYLHYPKVGLGHWPPLFYVMQAAWMAVFGDAPWSGILLVVVMTALLATLVYRVARFEFGSETAALACGVLFLLLPVVQMYGQMIMADMPVALLSFAAALVWARFMDTGERRYAVYFALLASAAILTKGNGYALVFVPPFAIVACRRWRLVLNPNLWLSAGLVALLTVPWNMVTRDLIVPTMQHNFGLGFLSQGGLFYLIKLFTLAGLAVTGFALAGIAIKIVLPFPSRNVEPVWASLFALLLAGQIFHSLVPAGLESRYLLASMAALILFMAAGVHWASSLLARAALPRYTVVAAAALIAAVFFSTVFSIPRKRSFGFNEIAEAMSTQPELSGKHVLCSSNADGEGLLVSEMARRDRARPSRVVARGSQMFARMGWNGQDYESLVRNTGDVKAVLNAIPADLVVLDRTPSREKWAHEALLTAALQTPEWQLAGVYPKNRTATTVHDVRLEVYRWTGARRTGPSRLRVELQPKPKIVLDLPPAP